MDNAQTETISTSEVAGSDRISAALAAYEVWDKANVQANYRGGVVEQSAEVKLGETLKKSTAGLWEKVKTNLKVVLDDLKELPEDDDEKKLIRLHQARTLIGGTGVGEASDGAAQSLAILEARPDLLSNEDVVDTLERRFKMDLKVGDKVREQVLHPDDPSNQITKEQMAVMEKVANVRPESETAILLGLVTGVAAVNERAKIVPTPNGMRQLDLDYSVLKAEDRHVDGYPLDIVASAAHGENNYPGLNTLKGLAGRDLSKLSERGRAVVMGAALAMTMRTLEGLRRKPSLSGVETTTVSQFGKIMDAVFPGQEVLPMVTEAGPRRALAEVVAGVARKDVKIGAELNSRELRVRDENQRREEEQRKLEEDKRVAEAAAAEVLRAGLEAEAARQKAEGAAVVKPAAPGNGGGGGGGFWNKILRRK